MKVSAIIPAYNEEKNIGRVLSVLIQIEEISEILVINDGSTDKKMCIRDRRSTFYG